MRIISQGACPSPRCNSSDAYTEYADGHGYCFSCRYYKPAKLTSIEQVASTLFKKSQDVYLSLPDDFTNKLPVEPLTWLKKYGLTQAEIEQQGYGWSESRQLLISPFADEQGNLVYWQGRYFPKRTPKVDGRGSIENLPIYIRTQGSPTPSVVIVEDLVSAIKVGRHMDACPLFGTNLSLFKVIEISKVYKDLYIWLDSDKIGTAHEFRARYKTLFNSVFVIFTNLDPKELSDLQIKESLSV